MSDIHTVSNISDIENCIVNSDNSRNLIVASNAPEICKSQPCILGIDEAGRGPVLGPMVYGTAYCPIENNESLLKNLGCADSKVLTESKRDDILDLICKQGEWLGWMIEIISPNYICNSMLKRQKYSLNEVSHDSAIGLIRRVLDSGVNVREIYVDTVGTPETYQRKLSELFPEQHITVSSKADSKYPIVSAASICAKVSRDLALKSWTFLEGINIEEGKAWGSGYPNDPVTKKFLSENVDPVFGFPQLVRFSWSTASKILKEKAVNIEGDELEEEEDDENKKTRSIKAFFRPKVEPDAAPCKDRHAFFKERCLNICDSL